MLLNILEILGLLACVIGVAWWGLHEIQRGIDTYDQDDEDWWDSPPTEDKD